MPHSETITGDAPTKGLMLTQSLIKSCLDSEGSMIVGAFGRDSKTPFVSRAFPALARLSCARFSDPFRPPRRSAPKERARSPQATSRPSRKRTATRFASSAIGLAPASPRAQGSLQAGGRLAPNRRHVALQLWPRPSGSNRSLSRDRSHDRGNPAAAHRRSSCSA